MIGRIKTIILSVIAVAILVMGFSYVTDRLLSSKKENNNGIQLQKETKISEEEKLSTAKLLGQNLIVGISEPYIDKEAENYLREIRPAGIVLYYRNYESSSQLEKLIDELQNIAKEETGEPFFIMIDEEPEGANRLNLFQNIFPLGIPDWRKIERDATTLKEIGINVNLAPVADFPFNDNTFLKKRIPVENQENLIAFNRRFINILKDRRIFATLKHFPGMGIFIKDPHKGMPSANIQKQALNDSLNIFKEEIEDGAKFVMTGHGVYENIDPKNPATFSSKIVKGLLINRLGFKGLVITDDLSDMPVVENDISSVDAGIKALKAGHHLIMYSHRLKDTKVIFNKMKERANSNRKLREVIESNHNKIINFKKKRLSFDKSQMH